jgi:LCP family protein required for cell wall assembly
MTVGVNCSSGRWRGWPGAAIVVATILSTLAGIPAERLQAMESSVPLEALAQQDSARMNILLLGIDQRPGQNPNKTRTDTMIIVTLDTQTQTAGMLSIPRDLYVPLPGRGQGRINTAHVYGGPDYAMRTVSENFDIPIDRYARVNFDVLTTLVDLVGGIDIYVDTNINDQTYPDMDHGYEPFVMAQGLHHMDGATTLKYARTRHESSDFTRMSRQQQIIMALRDRVLSTNALPLLLQNAPQILETLRDSISTNLSLPEMVQLILFVKDLPTDRINQVVVSPAAVRAWTTRQGASVLVPRPGRLPELAAQLYDPLAVAKAGEANTEFNPSKH